MKEDIQKLQKSAMTRPIMPEEVLYVLDRCPFLQIINPDATNQAEPTPVRFIQANTGWTIQAWDDALTSSPGEKLFGDTHKGKGTIRKQAFDTAAEMVEIAHQNGWSSIYIVDGHPLMQRSAWITAENLGMSVDGFTPSELDNKIRQRVTSTAHDIEALKQELRSS